MRTRPLLRTLLVGMLCHLLWTLSGVASLRAEEVAPVQRELLLFEEPEVTAAMKHAQPQREAPAAVTVVSSEEIRRLGYRTLAEALRGVRGFYVTGDRNYDYLGVRGFSRPGDYDDRILLLVNGHTYNDDIYQSASVGNDFGIDLEAVERIEVIRGPGSALYGGNALFAVINVVTFDGATKPGVHALVETGSYWRKRAQLSIGHVTEGGLSVFAGGSILDLDGQHELFYPEYDDPSTNDGIAEDVDGERALNFFLNAKWRGFTLQGGVNQRDKHIPTGSYGTLFNDEQTQGTDGHHFADLSYASTVAPNLHLSARAFYDGYRYHGTYVYVDDVGGRIKNEDRAWSDWFGGEVRARWEAWDRNALTAGAEYTYHPAAHQENYDSPGHQAYLDDERTYGTWGIYAQDELKVTSTLMVVAGLRFDRYYDRLQQVSPRAAVIWSATPQTTVKLLYGRAFRPPNLYEQYYAYPGSGIASVVNPDLDPERIATYEAVVEQELWHGIHGTLAFYHYDIDDLIEPFTVPSDDGGDPALQYGNGDTVRANGVEIETRVPLPRGSALKSSYCFQRASTSAGRLSNSPAHLGNLTLLFPLVWGIEGGVELIVVGPRDTRDGHRLETARIMNLTLDYVSPVPGLTGSIGLYNILDHTYPDPTGEEFVQDRLPQNGFTFRVQLGYAF
jgi:iron complex outermembrane receptor protein